MTKVQIFDGAMGTMLQQRGLAPGQSPEELNITNPEIVESVHLDYPFTIVVFISHLVG